MRYKKIRIPLFFTIGGVGYAIIEILWRGHTHWTMVIAGGICFVLFSEIAKRCDGEPLVFKATLAALGVTFVELIFGIIFNLIFGMEIWDYSDVPFNILGQICPLFTFFWGVLGLIFIPIAELMLNRFLVCRSG